MLEQGNANGLNEDRGRSLQYTERYRFYSFEAGSIGPGVRKAQAEILPPPLPGYQTSDKVALQVSVSSPAKWHHNMPTSLSC